MTCELRSGKVSAAKSDLMPRIMSVRGEDNISSEISDFPNDVSSARSV